MRAGAVARAVLRRCSASKAAARLALPGLDWTTSRGEAWRRGRGKAVRRVCPDGRACAACSWTWKQPWFSYRAEDSERVGWERLYHMEILPPQAIWPRQGKPPTLFFCSRIQMTKTPWSAHPMWTRISAPSRALGNAFYDPRRHATKWAPFSGHVTSGETRWERAGRGSLPPGVQRWTRVQRFPCASWAMFGEEKKFHDINNTFICLWLLSNYGLTMLKRFVS